MKGSLAVGGTCAASTSICRHCSLMSQIGASASVLWCFRVGALICPSVPGDVFIPSVDAPAHSYAFAALCARAQFLVHGEFLPILLNYLGECYVTTLLRRDVYA